MKKFYLIFLVLVGIFNIPQLKAATYTHRFNYNSGDFSDDSLTGVVKFEDTAPNAQTNLGNSVIPVGIDTTFIKAATFTYTPFEQESLVITIDDIQAFTITHINPGSTDFSINLTSQLSNLQFAGNGGAYNLSMNSEGNFELDASVPGGSGIGADFTLNTPIQYVSPGPLPVLGLLPAFKSISSLKKRYKLKNVS